MENKIGPIDADMKNECPACGFMIRKGQFCTLISLGPGDDPKIKRFRKKPKDDSDGMADYIALEPSGPAWFIEFKNANPITRKKITYLNPNQRDFRDRILAADHICIVVWFPEDLTDVLRERGFME